MHKMTRAAETGAASVRAPFSHNVFRFKDDSAELYEQNGARFVRLSSKDRAEQLFRVTRVIGGRHREDFAGLEVTGDDPASARMVEGTKNELILPVSFVYATDSFRLKGYSVMARERPGMRAGGVWNQTCILCHNTAPYFWSLFDALLGPGARAYQGEVVDPLLPPERRVRYDVHDEGALGRALETEIAAMGGDRGARGTPPHNVEQSPVHDEDLRARIAGAIETTRGSLSATSLVELGIGCESCHGGSREHAADPRRRPSFEPTSALFSVASAEHELTQAAVVNRTCARCHQVLFSRYPFTWEGGMRRSSSPGGSHISSGEARDFLLGGCADALSCTACHDPHGEDRPERMRALETADVGNRVCTACHSQYASQAELAAHTHHSPGGAGGVCINCHMPKKNMSLGYELTRYHRIASPNERAKVERDRPLECALCHPGGKVIDLVTTMEKWWGKRYDRSALMELYGADLSVPVLPATLDRGKPHEKAVALEVLGEARAREAAPLMARELFDPYPLVRYYAVQALAHVANDPQGAQAISLDGTDADIARRGERWLAEHGLAHGALLATPGAAPRSVENDED
jgi:predicted CXXCH cytochrome family protein